MSERRIQVGFLGGIQLAGNVRTLLVNLRRILRKRSTAFDCDLILSANEEAPVGFRQVAIDTSEVSTARDRIATLSRAIRRYAHRQDPDILFQVTRFPTHGTATALAGRVTGTPTITRLAGDNFREHKFAETGLERVQMYALKNMIGQAAVHLPDAVVVLGPNGRRDLSARFRCSDVWMIPQPVNRDRFSPVSEDEQDRLRSELGVTGHKRMLLTVGRVSRRKGAQTIQKSAQNLSRDMVWYVVGGGPMRSTLSDVSGIRAIGRVPHDRVVDYYRAADLYVHPSLHDGLPNVLLEATACGTPSIARDVGECTTVATETFDDVDELEALLAREYGPVELDDRFDDKRLGKKYESLLTEVAR